MRRVLLRCVAGFAMVIGCYEPTVVRLQTREPELASFALNNDARDGSVLLISASARDSSIGFVENDVVLVNVTTTSGDEEVVALERMFCGDRRCAAFSVGMKPGRTMDPVVRLMSRVPARIHFLDASAESGDGYVWHNYDMPSVLRQIREVDGVEDAEQGALFCIHTCTGQKHMLFAARPTENLAPVKTNGWIEAAPGDSIIVSYRQPSGQTIRAATRMR